MWRGKGGGYSLTSRQALGHVQTRQLSVWRSNYTVIVWERMVLVLGFSLYVLSLGGEWVDEEEPWNRRTERWGSMGRKGIEGGEWREGDNVWGSSVWCGLQKERRCSVLLPLRLKPGKGAWRRSAFGQTGLSLSRRPAAPTSENCQARPSDRSHWIKATRSYPGSV